ncbi:hypothetical protein FRB97_001474 [Tulasnella sp. 331]|nr:hypothetical protein FRB97_001474 [Tulasnella sp. 331]
MVIDNAEQIHELEGFKSTSIPPSLSLPMAEKLIILYDIPSTFETQQAWSYNTWKARLVLNYKGIPYRTEWVTYPDIEQTFRKVDLPPLKMMPNGKPLYTCPAIIDYIADPIFGKRVAESTKIAHYLDETYASEQHGPTLFPKGTEAAQNEFINEIDPESGSGLKSHVSILVVALSVGVLDARGAEYINREREKRLGRPVADVGREGSLERKEAWDGVKRCLDKIAATYDKNKEGQGQFFTGKAITYADIYLISFFLWLRYLPSDRDGPDVKSGWDIVKTLNEGRWQKLVDKFEKYLEVK